MKHIDLLDISDVEMQKNMVLLIEDEDQELSGASTPACVGAVSAVVSAVSAISALFQVTTACTTRCYRP
ncbi:TPA: hypothetical protein TXT45_000426 [Streptococcus suis]|uniref:hypothetical protein n=1 Tax=Streptococcus suis TaxID=1307 RepID=UPI00041CC86A|nr:hypothetical protein [Streptococcus suis]NQM28880.1 hypothetical protein [Streptococcus suis]HEL1701855.1 hypothetical protein [Streptococcus suis]HEM3212217.1 hypothetical protein [Streptococcus suis NT77]HEM4251996.1 hypothetical protein [Streptococcus suis]HEM4283258.1 hypothetical protein [Streptococcus suis]